MILFENYIIFNLENIYYFRRKFRRMEIELSLEGGGFFFIPGNGRFD